MNKTEIAPSIKDAHLQDLVADLVNHLGYEFSLESGVGKQEKQVKYMLASATEILEKLSNLEGAELIERVYQKDNYIIPKDTHPSFQSEYLRLREENYQESEGAKNSRIGLINHLTYKSNSELLSDNVETRTSITIDLDDNQFIDALDFLNEKEVKYREIRKERIVFRYKGAILSVDQGVQYKDEQENSNSLGSGTFLEIMEDDLGEYSELDSIAEELGILEPNITTPYVNIEFFSSHYLDKLRRSGAAIINTAETQKINQFEFVDYDSMHDCLSTQIDWNRVLAEVSPDIKNSISASTEKQQGLLKSLKKKIETLITKINEKPDDALISVVNNNNQNGGRIVNTIKIHSGHVDGFKNYPPPTKFLKDYVTIQLSGLSHKQISGDSVRVMLTVGRTLEGTVVFFPHKIFNAKDEIKQNSWIDSHKIDKT